MGDKRQGLRDKKNKKNKNGAESRLRILRKYFQTEAVEVRKGKGCEGEQWKRRRKHESLVLGWGGEFRCTHLSSSEDGKERRGWHRDTGCLHGEGKPVSSLAFPDMTLRTFFPRLNLQRHLWSVQGCLWKLAIFTQTEGFDLVSVHYIFFLMMKRATMCAGWCSWPLSPCLWHQGAEGFPEQDWGPYCILLMTSSASGTMEVTSPQESWPKEFSSIDFFVA